MIRKFKEEDAEICSEIVNECIKNSRNLTKKAKEKLRKEATPEKLKQKSKKRDYFVYTKNNKPIAIGGLKKNEVIRMYTHPKFQNRGIGTQILKRIVKEAKKKGIKKLFLYTHPRASKFYLRNGFEIIRKLKDKGMSVVYMEKIL